MPGNAMMNALLGRPPETLTDPQPHCFASCPQLGRCALLRRQDERAMHTAQAIAEEFDAGPSHEASQHAANAGEQRMMAEIIASGCEDGPQMKRRFGLVGRKVLKCTSSRKSAARFANYRPGF